MRFPSPFGGHVLKLMRYCKEIGVNELVSVPFRGSRSEMFQIVSMFHHQNSKFPSPFGGHVLKLQYSVISM